MSDPYKQSPLRILLVEDEGSMIETLIILLSREGHKVQVAKNLLDARLALVAGFPDLLIADCFLPDGSGLDLAREYRGKLPILICTGDSSEERVRGIKEVGAECIFKPFSPSALVTAVDLAYSFHAAPRH